MEKRAKKSNNTTMFQKATKLFFAVLLLGNISSLKAQETNTPEAGKQYTLAMLT